MIHGIRELIVGAAICSGLCGFGGTIYVDASNVGGPWDGLTPATAWQTIGEGLDHLAVTNASVQGGHSVLVEVGTYVEDITITNLHAGQVGTYNTLLSTNLATIEGSISFVLGSCDFIIDGFNITSPGTAILFGSNVGAHRNIFRNCNIYGSGAAINLNRGSSDVTIDHCNIVHNNGVAVRHQVTYRTTVKNCNIVNNAGGGVYSADSRFAFFLTNNLFCGNAFNICVGGIYNTPEEFPEMSVGPSIVKGYVTNCIVANPGFAALNDGWDFSVVYAGSPITNAGVDGSHIGAHQDLAIRAVSSNTYYVDQSIGDDSNNGLGENAGSAWASITNAATVAVAGDTVVVKTGDYPEPVLFTNTGVEGRQVVFHALGDVVAGDATAETAVHFRRITGFDFSGFKCTALGTAVRLESSALVNMRGIEIYSSRTGLVFHTASSNSLTSSTVYSNSAYGLYFDSGSANMINGLSLHHNSATAIQSPAGGSGYNRYYNCNIYQNSSHGFYCYTGTDGLVFLNCNIYSNGGNGLYPRGSRLSAVNCIIMQNGAYGVNEYYSSCRVFLDNNCFFDNSSGNFNDIGGSTWNTAVDINSQADCANNMVQNPALKNPPLNMRLCSGSPCTDAGAPDTLTNLSVVIPCPARDYFGKRRPIDSGPDIGSYEFPPRGFMVFSY